MKYQPVSNLHILRYIKSKQKIHVRACQKILSTKKKKNNKPAGKKLCLFHVLGKNKKIYKKSLFFCVFHFTCSHLLQMSLILIFIYKEVKKVKAKKADLRFFWWGNSENSWFLLSPFHPSFTIVVFLYNERKPCSHYTPTVRPVNTLHYTWRYWCLFSNPTNKTA